MSNHQRKPSDPIENLAIGKIVEVDGTHIVAELDSEITELTRVYGGIIYPIGQFGSIIRVHYGRAIIYGYVSRLRMKAEYQQEKGIPIDASSTDRVVEADLFGEGEWKKEGENWNLKFRRGVSTYPLPQQQIYLTPQSELKFIYGEGGDAPLNIGEHVGTGGATAFAEMNELLGKHTAIVGSTGSGKSGTVAAVLHSILEKGETENLDKWNPRIVLLDPHNEYGKAFKDNHKRLSTEEGSLKLPYWLLDLEETLSLLIGKTEYAATSQANIIKNALLAVREKTAEEVLDIDSSEITVDSPIPYLLGNPSGLDDFGEKDGETYDIGLVGEINAQRPNNRSRNDHKNYNKILKKLSSLISDSRLDFMMEDWDGSGDKFSDIAMQFFGDGDSLRIVDLSGVPNEVAGITSSVISRILFSVKIWQSVEEREKSPVLLVCEEAHRYVPNRGEAQYEAAQEAIKRLAKEGRKYGIGLILISQRPSELEPTVLSQCNSWLVLRITNDQDRNHVRSVLPDSMSGLTKVLSSLRRREAIFVGQATLLPSRVRIRKLEKEKLPRSHDINFNKGWQHDSLTEEELNSVVKRWRLQQKEA